MKFSPSPENIAKLIPFLDFLERKSLCSLQFNECGNCKLHFLDLLKTHGRQGEVRQEQPPRERRGRSRSREELISGANNFQSEVHASLFCFPDHV
jgi:hypothetical protein